MRHFALAFLAGLAATSPIAVVPGLAQTAAPLSPSPTPPPTAADANPAAPSPTVAAPSDAQQSIRSVRETCRETAKSDGLKGDAIRKAVSDCVVRVRPDLAGREQCRLDGFAKGLRKEELRAFVKDCAKSKG